MAGLRPGVLMCRTHRAGASRLIFVTLLVILSFAAACSGGATSVRIEALDRDPVTGRATGAARITGNAIRVGVPEGYRGLMEHLTPELTSPDAPVRLTSPPAPAEVRVVEASTAGAGSIPRRWSVVTAASRLEMDGVTLATLEDAARGGGLLTASEWVEPLSPLLPAGGRLIAAPRDQLAAWLSAAPGGLALMPVDAVDVRVRALALDGVDPVRGEGDLTSYPLTTWVRVENDGTHRAMAIAARLSELLARPEQPLHLAFTGDLIPARCVYDQMRRAGDWATPFRLVAERLSTADLTIGSLDAAVSDKGTPIGCQVTFSLLAPPEVTGGYPRRFRRDQRGDESHQGLRGERLRRRRVPRHARSPPRRRDRSCRGRNHPRGRTPAGGAHCRRRPLRLPRL